MSSITATPAKALVAYVLDGETLKAQVEKASSSRMAKAAPGPSAAGYRPGSTVDAILAVLRAADGPLSPTEVYERIQADGLAPGLKGATPVATIGARLATSVKNGQHGVQRTAPGRFTVKAEEA
ncbi:MAG: HTH domain-containing protein [Solirubrobacteraceae bacterium]